MEHNSSLPPTDALLAVVTAVRAGSFSAAAAALDVTHGAISRRVSLVEKWAGVRIFRRHGRGVQVTFEAQHLIAVIEHALALLKDSPRHRAQQPALDTVCISVVPSFARLWLMPRLATLEGDPKDLHIEIDINQHVVSLTSSRIAIRHGRGGWPGVLETPLFEESLLPVAGADIAERLGQDAHPNRLLSFPLLFDSSDIGWQKWFSAKQIAFERRAQDRVFPDYDLTLLAASQGLGIALLREPYGRRVSQALRLRAVSTHRVKNDARFFVVRRSGPVANAVTRLADRILSGVRRDCSQRDATDRIAQTAPT